MPPLLEFVLLYSHVKRNNIFRRIFSVFHNKSIPIIRRAVDKIVVIIIEYLKFNLLEVDMHDFMNLMQTPALNQSLFLSVYLIFQNIFWLYAKIVFYCPK